MCISIIPDRITSFRSSAAFTTTSVAFSNDTPKWRYLKKQVMASLKQHGDGLTHLEAATLHYGGQLVKAMEVYDGKPFEPGSLMTMTVAHIILSLLFGDSSVEDAPAFVDGQQKGEGVLRPTGEFLILDIVPFLRHFVPPVKHIWPVYI